jgi:hypothetical protein
MQLRSKLVAIASVATLAVGLAVGFAGPAGASAPAARTVPADTYFYLINYNSGYCLGIDGGGLARQQACDLTNEQEWYQANPYPGNGKFQLENFSAANQACLSVQDGSTAVNTQLTGYTCKSYSSRPDQYWLLTNTGKTKNWEGNLGLPCYSVASEITLSYWAGTSGASKSVSTDVINANPGNTSGNGVNADVWCLYVLGTNTGIGIAGAR